MHELRAFLDGEECRLLRIGENRDDNLVEQPGAALMMSTCRRSEDRKIRGKWQFCSRVLRPIECQRLRHLVQEIGFPEGSRGVGSSCVSSAR